MNDELFPIVDEQGNVVGCATRKECHSGSMLLHPVVHLHIVSEDGNSIYLQQRSLDKKIQPGRWDTAVGGHVDYGESIKDALIRESREELGVCAANALFVKQYPFQSSVERELVHVHYICVGPEFMTTPDATEVIDARFWSMDDVRANLGKGIFTPNFESEFMSVLVPAGIVKYEQP
jgi:hypothetical protein